VNEYNMDLAPETFSNSVTTDAFVRSFPFYVTSCGKFYAGEQYYTKRDYHPNYLLIVTEDGCGWMQSKGQKCMLEKDRAVLIDCTTYQEYGTLANSRWTFWFLHFGANAMDGYCPALLDNLTAIPLRTPGQARQWMQEIYEHTFSQSVLSYAAQSNAVSALLTELVCSLADGQGQGSQFSRPDIAALADYIRGNCEKQLHIEDFMEHTRLSKHHLIRTFERQIGMSPYRYLHMCRINRAEQMLRTTQSSVAEIAYAVGYNDPILFIRHFKTFNRVTPGEYRKQAMPF